MPPADASRPGPADTRLRDGARAGALVAADGWRAAAVAAIVAAAAGSLYWSTLLPGVDYGDTGGLQAALGWRGVSARQAYPLYYALGRIFLRLTGGADPAFASNLMSACFGAAAAGLLAWVTIRVTRTAAAGAIAGLALAVSYTFWSQAIIAEVYTLHLTFIGLCLAALIEWRDRPTLARLSVFFGVYALGFGNHLSMVLLLPAFAAFLLAAAPGGPRALLRPRPVVCALLLAAAGTLQYLPNLASVFGDPLPPRSVFDGISTFWFEVTKADWRETMVLGVQESELANRAGMWWFDVRQQFGTIGLVAALAGGVALWRERPVEAALVAVAWIVNALFAFTYNVGDTHVFYLPAHYFMALWIGCAVLAPRALTPSIRRAAAVGLTVLLLALLAWRGYETWPAVDRHDDRRALEVVARLTRGIGDGRAVLGAQVNWQVENALLYYGRWVRPDIAWFRTAEGLLQLPWIVQDNAAAGRRVLLTRDAAAAARAAFGDALILAEDAETRVEPIPVLAGRVPAGAAYVLAVLHPYPDQPLDPAEVSAAVQQLAPGARLDPDAQFSVIVGRAGARPSLLRSEPHPFRQHVRADSVDAEIRMDSWLPTDTFRRAGFGHVIVGHRRVATFDRGLTLLWFTRDGRPAEVHYRGGLYAPEPRWNVTAQVPTLQ